VERDALPPTIRALLDPARHAPPPPAVELVETHISWVLLAGDHAIKIKKPVNLGFLDFSTLERRRELCHEELRLNRRFAPELYLDVVPITGTETDPRIGGDGPPIEFAVRMLRFPGDAQLDHMLERGALEAKHLDQAARDLAGFHERVAVAGPESPWGTPGAVRRPVVENFEQLRAHLDDPDALRTLERIEQWSDAAWKAGSPDFEARRRGGFVRECHGDVHLKNMALFRGRVIFFDCLEFDPALRWIDVINEVAFPVMDLEDRRRSDLARRFLNVWLEFTGDYAGLRVLRFYLVYRALVRAKVVAIRLRQGGLAEPERADVARQCREYLALADGFLTPRPVFLWVTHGLSGSGKSTLAEAVGERLGAVRLRSDVERKRLSGLAPLARSGAGLDQGLYAADATRATYERLAGLAADVVHAGFPAIVDGAFLKRAQRDALRAVAERLGVPFAILDLRAPDEALCERISERERTGHDPSEADLAVLEHQKRTREPPGADEPVVPIDAARLRDGLSRILDALERTKGVRSRGGT
jgi:aminoglycoside phosphotransferase family enzyme/predicted kinase